MKNFLNLIMFSFPTGLLASALISELTMNGKVVWHDLYQKPSFYYILTYIFLFFVYYLLRKYIMKQIKKLTNLLAYSIVRKLLAKDSIRNYLETSNKVNQIFMHENKHFIAKVIFVKVISDGQMLLLLSPSIQLAFDLLVSVYYRENGVDELIAIGRVYNVQEDKNVQVTVNFPLEDYKEILHSLVRNTPDILDKLVIKPNIKHYDFINIGGQ